MYKPEQALAAPYAPVAFTLQQITLVLISVRGFMAQEDLYIMKSVINSVFCLTTGPKPPPKRFLHIVRSRASSFK